MDSTNTTFTVSVISHGALTHEQILVIVVAGACGALVVVVLIAVAYALVYSRRRRHRSRRHSRQRHNSQVSMARSDFWPFSTVHPPSSPTTNQMSPEYSRHVVFEDDPRLTLASRDSHVTDARMVSGSRTNTLATLERGSKDVTSVYQPRSCVNSDTGEFVALPPSATSTDHHGPYFVTSLTNSGRSPYHRDLRMVQFNRGAFMMGHDPFLWKPRRIYERSYPEEEKKRAKILKRSLVEQPQVNKTFA